MLTRLNISLRGIIENPNLGLGALSTTYAGDAVCQAHLESLTERSDLIHRDLQKRIQHYKTTLGIESNEEEDVSCE